MGGDLQNLAPVVNECLNAAFGYVFKDCFGCLLVGFDVVEKKKLDYVGVELVEVCDELIERKYILPIVISMNIFKNY